MRTIRVTGSSSLMVRPTLMKVIIKIEGTETEFDDTVERSERDTKNIKNIIEKLGFERSDLKTLSFDIEGKFENYYDENDRYKKRFVGYKYSHKMFIEFPIDNKLLGKLLYALVKSNIEPEFNIGYTIEENAKKVYRNTLIEDSVKKAIERAEILAKAAGVKLGKIITIDYSNRSHDFYEETLEFTGMDYTEERIDIKGYDFDIEANDITISDSVNMVWEIE